jgi:hypothetical protein
MEVDSRYLESSEYGDEPASLLGIAAGIYGYSAIDMLAQFRSSGRLYAPWTGPFTGGKRIGASMIGRGVERNGQRLRGVDKYGKMLMGASRVAGATNAYFIASDPIWFATKFLRNPFMLAAGAAWFGTGASIQNSSRALERNQYMKMSVPFNDSERSYTSRQRAVRAIAESHLQARSAIGGEAQLYHR